MVVICPSRDLNSGDPAPVAEFQRERVIWIELAPDRLPLVGGLPLGPQGREDQPRLLPRMPGLLLCSAFGSRGISWAALCGQVAAAQLTGAPLPVEADLLDAIDPARFRVRESRRRTSS